MDFLLCYANYIAFALVVAACVRSRFDSLPTLIAAYYAAFFVFGAAANFAAGEIVATAYATEYYLVFCGIQALFIVACAVLFVASGRPVFLAYGVCIFIFCSISASQGIMTPIVTGKH